MTTVSPNPQELKNLYRNRFDDRSPYRRAIWDNLLKYFFSSYIIPGASILDLGCGYGEFINAVSARQRFAMDMNPDTRKQLDSGVTFLEQDCSQPWKGVAEESLDLVFTSNFLEHLPSKECLSDTLRLSYGALKIGGRIIAMGPNIRIVGNKYWDFWDHHIPLTENSLSEVLITQGFVVERCISRFLPFTMSAGPKYPPFCLQVYLRIPALWNIFGGQFLIVATKE